MARHSLLCVLISSVLANASCRAAEMAFIRVADDGQAFVMEDSGYPFVPWGFNYDHDETGRLLEDYWDQQWSVVESDFSEMKQLGANVVRIHLQFGKFMESASTPRKESLQQLSRLLQLAERTGLYLNITGLGCYHKSDVPAWYDSLSEADRWKAQAVFWEAVAAVCADSPAVFCYDLMNEPVVPGGDGKRKDWLGPGFAGKHFTQFIALERAGRDRAQVAGDWIRTLRAAIRRHDQRHLITVGLVPWSLNRPGLTSGFDPDVIADELDFVAMHIYPEQGKSDEAIDILKGFARAGKPVVIEEIFPLKCDAQELGRFIELSRPFAQGWIGFYWGKTPDEYRQAPQGIPEAMTLSWLTLFQQKKDEVVSVFHNVRCAGTYPHHLQGVCVDQKSIYWSFTTRLVKTDLRGRLLQDVPVANHHGDLCHHEGRLYVAVNHGQFNHPDGNADSWVWVYDAESLKEVARYKVPEVTYGAGGIGFREGHFFVVGGLPEGFEQNFVYEYDAAFRFVRRHDILSGHTHLGIQTAAFSDGHWWFGCYGDPKILLVTDAEFRMSGRYEFDCSLGIVGLPSGQLLAAGGRCDKASGCTGYVRIAVPDEKTGIRYIVPD